MALKKIMFGQNRIYTCGTKYFWKITILFQLTFAVVIVSITKDIDLIVTNKIKGSEHLMLFITT